MSLSYNMCAMATAYTAIFRRSGLQRRTQEINAAVLLRAKNSSYFLILCVCSSLSEPGKAMDPELSICIQQL